ncbi:MAG: CBS domain-containing protein [Thermoproteota archaeon]
MVKVKDIAKKKLITAYPKDTVLDAFERMSERRIGHLLIIDPDNRRVLRGILTRTDIMHALKKGS